MRSIPGPAPQAMDKSTQVRCSCEGQPVIYTLQPGERLAVGADRRAGHTTAARSVTCSGCGQTTTLRLLAASGL